MIMPANGLPMMHPGATPSWPGAYVPLLAFSLDCGALLRGISAQTSTHTGAGPSQVSPSAASPKLAPRLKVTRVLCIWCDFSEDSQRVIRRQSPADCLVPLVPHSSRSTPKHKQGPAGTGSKQPSDFVLNQQGQVRGRVVKQE